MTHMLFENLNNADLKKGNFLILFKTKKNRLKYLACIVIGLPVWFVVGILIALAHRFLPEITGSKEIMTLLPTKEMVLWSYVGLSLGDLFSGILSQVYRSRKKEILLSV
jgi:hypothetical protein